MNTNRHPVLIGVTITLILAGCGGSPDEETSSDDAPSSAPDIVIEPVPTTAEADSTDPQVSPSDPSTTTAAAPSTTPPTSGPPQELADVPGLTEITVTTPPSGNGEHPLLAWEPVDPAASYSLVLTQADGQVYWAWSGVESQIWLGGSNDRPPATASGPYMVEPMTLRVFALNADGAVFAASQPIEIAP